MTWLDGTCYVRGCKSEVKYILYWLHASNINEDSEDEESELIWLDAREVCEKHEHIQKAALEEVLGGDVISQMIWLT